MLTDIGQLRQILQSKQASIECVECHQDFQYNGTRRTLEPGLYELGIECPHCKAWYHSYFITDEIISLPRDNRKQKREYKAKIQKLNNRERKKRGLRKVNGRWVTDGR